MRQHDRGESQGGMDPPALPWPWSIPWLRSYRTCGNKSTHKPLSASLTLVTVVYVRGRLFHLVQHALAKLYTSPYPDVIVS